LKHTELGSTSIGVHAINKKQSFAATSQNPLGLVSCTWGFRKTPPSFLGHQADIVDFPLKQRLDVKDTTLKI